MSNPTSISSHNQTPYDAANLSANQINSQAVESQKENSSSSRVVLSDDPLSQTNDNGMTSSCSDVSKKDKDQKKELNMAVLLQNDNTARAKIEQKLNLPGKNDLSPADLIKISAAEDQYKIALKQIKEKQFSKASDTLSAILYSMDLPDCDLKGQAYNTLAGSKAALEKYDEAFLICQDAITLLKNCSEKTLYLLYTNMIALHNRLEDKSLAEHEQMLKNAISCLSFPHKLEFVLELKNLIMTTRKSIKEANKILVSARDEAKSHPFSYISLCVEIAKFAMMNKDNALAQINITLGLQCANNHQFKDIPPLKAELYICQMTFLQEVKKLDEAQLLGEKILKEFIPGSDSYKKIERYIQCLRLSKNTPDIAKPRGGGRRNTFTTPLTRPEHLVKENDSK